MLITLPSTILDSNGNGKMFDYNRRGKGFESCRKNWWTEEDSRKWSDEIKIKNLYLFFFWIWCFVVVHVHDIWQLLALLTFFLFPSSFLIIATRQQFEANFLQFHVKRLKANFIFDCLCCNQWSLTAKLEPKGWIPE